MHYTRLMSTDESRITAKSKMELSATKDNGESLTFATESSTPDSAGVLDTLPDVLKNMLKITIKIK